MHTESQKFLELAINLARKNIEIGGRPFGAVLVKNGEIIASGVNEMLATHDPASHAEMNALRSAGKSIQSTQFIGAEMYASGQPCPMCMAAMRMTGFKKIVFAISNEQAEPFGLSTAHVAEDLGIIMSQQNWANIEHYPIDPNADLYQYWKSKIEQ